MVNQYHNDIYRLVSHISVIFKLGSALQGGNVCPEEGDKFASCWNRNGAKHTDSGARLSLNAGSAALHVTVGQLIHLVPWFPLP